MLGSGSVSTGGRYEITLRSAQTDDERGRGGPERRRGQRVGNGEHDRARLHRAGAAGRRDQRGSGRW
ncbi:hypothetical protein [Sphingomonas aerolata]|uniref:hypothetical protein n=1 Tax=Sphingomonas aerolata TaxID=185951 RepID=UPI003A5BC6EA